MNKSHHLRFIRMPVASSDLNTVFKEVEGVASNALKAARSRKQVGTNVLIERFVGGLLNGSQPPVTAEEGKEAVRITEMVVARYHEKYHEALGEKRERRGYFGYPEVTRLINAHRSWRANLGLKLWSLPFFECWCREYGDA